MGSCTRGGPRWGGWLLEGWKGTKLFSGGRVRREREGKDGEKGYDIKNTERVFSCKAMSGRLVGDLDW